MAELNVKAAAASFLSSIIARTWEDDSFREKLIKDPEGELAALGYGNLYDSNGNQVTVKVADAPAEGPYEPCTFEDDTMTIYLPKKPAAFEQFDFKGQFTSGICC